MADVVVVVVVKRNHDLHLDVHLDVHCHLDVHYHLDGRHLVPYPPPLVEFLCLHPNDESNLLDT